MGARHSRRQKSQTTQEEQTEQSQTQHQSLVVATGRGSELVEANVDPTEDEQGSANNSLVITICMLKMEPSEDTASGGGRSEVPSSHPQEIGGSSDLPSATMHPKCGCYENNNCPVSLASAPSSSSSSTSAPVYGTIGAINNNNSTQPTAAKCGCNCSKPDGINNLESFNGNPSMQASASDCANNNEASSLISDILSNHHHLLHHHHHHHHHHHIGPWTCPTSSFLAVATTASPVPTTSYSANVICDSTTSNNNVNMSNNASVLNRTMQQHQQQLRQQQLQQQQQLFSASSNVTASPSSVCEMSDKLNDLQLNNQSDADAHSSEEHPFSVGECPRCAEAAARQGTAAAGEEKILNTTVHQDNGAKEPTKTVTSASPAAAAAAESASNANTTVEAAAAAAAATMASATVTATTSVSSSSCCRQPILTTTTTTTRTLAPLPIPTSTLFSALTPSGKKSRVCKNCRSPSCPNQANSKNNSGKACSSSNSNSSSSSNSNNNSTSPSSTTGAKSKKGNWGLKFNCAKLRGSKSSQTAAAASPAASSSTSASSSSASTAPAAVSPPQPAGPSPSSASVAGGSSIISSSSRLLRSESEKTDSCICTLYRKVEDLPSTVSSNNGYPSASNPLMIPHQQIRYQHHHLDGSTSNGPGGTFGQVGISHNGNHPSNHAFLFPPGAGAAASHHDLHATTIIHRIEGSAAHALWGTGAGHAAPNSLIVVSAPIDISRFNSTDDFSLEDLDERARLQRELEIREGVDAPPNFTPRGLMSGGTLTGGSALGAVGAAANGANAAAAANHPIAFLCTSDTSSAFSLLQRGILLPSTVIHAEEMPRVHSQVDFIHCLVPDLQKITSCCFYWGKMDRYEAEKLLEGKPEGTFLLRDSAQEEFLFSVSFRKYNRSLHARIEQFNHKFSFDSRDPGVYTASTVTGLLEHYKDPSCVMFFEPMLTYPLNRKFVFSLQQLCRATIVSNTTYDGINDLSLPKSLKSYLKEYHYRQRVRYRPLDDPPHYHDL